MRAGHEYNMHACIFITFITWMHCGYPCSMFSALKTVIIKLPRHNCKSC